MEHHDAVEKECHHQRGARERRGEVVSSSRYSGAWEHTVASENWQRERITAGAPWGDATDVCMQHPLPAIENTPNSAARKWGVQA